MKASKNKRGRYSAPICFHPAVPYTTLCFLSVLKLPTRQVVLFLCPLTRPDESLVTSCYFLLYFQVLSASELILTALLHSSWMSCPKILQLPCCVNINIKQINYKSLHTTKKPLHDLILFLKFIKIIWICFYV